tara:strand:- start:509 stop:1015 length:507 start_codon:yes stop_codon:yes gene_type:complete
MIYNIKNLAIYFFISLSVAQSHPFHATITSFNCNPNNQSIEITIKLFTNDLESVLKEEGRSDLRIDSESNRTTIDSLIFDYIKNNLSLSLNDKRRKILWVGKEFENDITWSYLEFKNVKNISGTKISIENKLFLELFDDQLNICHFYCSEKPETLMLHKENYYGEINF